MSITQHGRSHHVRRVTRLADGVWVSCLGSVLFSLELLRQGLERMRLMKRLGSECFSGDDDLCGGKYLGFEHSLQQRKPPEFEFVELFDLVDSQGGNHDPARGRVLIPLNLGGVILGYCCRQSLAESG